MSIASEIQRLQGAKTDITTAIANKGVTIPAGTTLDSYDDYIAQIPAGGTYQSKTVTPNAAGQTVSPDQGYDALSSVVINGDQNLVAENVKKDVTIFGTTGSYEGGTPNLQAKSAYPSKNGETVTADSGYDGLSQVEIYGDTDLVSSNIKKNVNIFGVIGTLPTETEIIGRYFDTALTNQKYKYNEVVIKNPVFDTSALTTMAEMFVDCGLQQIDTTGFDTDSVTIMSGMCKNCPNLETFIGSGIDTSSVTNMAQMFKDDVSLTSVDVSAFNTSNVTTMEEMFSGCTSLTSLNLSTFNTSSLQITTKMFYNCTSLANLNLKNFDYTNITTTTDMFTGIPANCKIIVGSDDLKNWILSVRSDLTNVVVVSAMYFFLGKINKGICWSTNGTSYTRVSLSNYDLKDGAYGNGIFVVVGDTNRWYSSYDGKSWSLLQVNVSGIRILFINGTFYVLSGGKIATSTDGINWSTNTSLGTETGYTSGYADMTYSNGYFWVVNKTQNLIFYSNNLDDWNTVSNLPIRVQHIKYANGIFVAVGLELDNNNFAVAYSTNGTTWTQGATSRTQSTIYDNTQGIAYDDTIGKFVTSFFNYIAYSTDGMSWTVTGFNGAGYSGLVSCADGKYIMGTGSYGFYGTGFYSNDGVNFSTVSGLPYETNYYWATTFAVGSDEL